VDIERRRALRVWWLVAFVAALRVIQMTRLHVIVWDEFEYFHATRWVSQGLVPFRDFWEHHSPLQWFLFAPVAALVRSPGVSAIVALRWAQLPLWIAAFILMAKWTRRAGASAQATALAFLLAPCATQFMLPAMEYRLDAVGCALYVLALFLVQRGFFFGAGAALCLAGFANMRVGPLLVVTGIVIVLRTWRNWRVPLRFVAGGVAAFAACATYFLATHSAAIAIRRAWTETYIANRYAGTPPDALLTRLAAPFGLVRSGFDLGAIDAGAILLIAISTIGLAHVLWTSRHLRDDLWFLIWLQAASFAFVAIMKFVYIYHFLILYLLALPFAAHAFDLLLERRRKLAIAAIVVVAVTVGTFASLFRGKEDDLDYQDVVMRDADRFVPPDGRVLDGIGYALRREPAYRYWFMSEIVFTLEKHGVFEHYDIAANPPAAVMADLPTRRWLVLHPEQLDFVRRHYLPRWPELWLPAMNAVLTPSSPRAQFVVPVDAMYLVRASGPIRMLVDGVERSASDTLPLRRKQRIDVAAGVTQQIGVIIKPVGNEPLLLKPPHGETLDSLAAPRTHVPRLW